MGLFPDLLHSTGFVVARDVAMCPYCATPVEPSRVDLDPALMTQTKTITLVDETKRARFPAPSVVELDTRD